MDKDKKPISEEARRYFGRKTRTTDIVAYGDTCEAVLRDCKANGTANRSFYGKADYGYFVQVYSDNYTDKMLTSFNTDTKAGARYFANMLGKELGTPVDSDWEVNYWVDRP